MGAPGPRHSLRDRQRPRPHTQLRNGARLAVLLVLIAGPLGFGAVHERVFIPLLATLYLAGAVSWAHGHWARSHGRAVARVPGRRALLLLHAVVLLQLLPLPPFLLALLSPGSYAFHAGAAGSLESWRGISVAPALTLRGLAFLLGMSALYATVIREFRGRRWRHRLVYALIATGFVITGVALVQRTSAEPTRIYGYWKPDHAWAVFGPYVNSRHYAGFVLLSMLLAIGVLLASLERLRKSWSRRRGWLAAFDPPGLAAIWWSATLMFLGVGLLLSGARAAAGGLVVGLGLVLVGRGRGRLLGGLAVAAAVALPFLWANLSGVIRGFETRGIKASRIDLWSDQLRLLPHYPGLGYGLNAMLPAYRPLQRFVPTDAVGEAHNEYLQLLLDLGVLGSLPAFFLLGRLLWTALVTARGSPLALGISAAVVASAANNAFDFNWQIPANAAAFFSLCGLVMGAARNLDPAGERDLE